MASCISLSVGPHCNSSLSQKLTSQGLLNLKALTQYAQHPSEARFRQTPPPPTHTPSVCASSFWSRGPSSAKPRSSRATQKEGKEQTRSKKKQKG